MSDTTFVSKVTHVLATWLNDVNKTVYRAIGIGGVAPTTPVEVRNNLGLSAIIDPTGASLIGKRLSLLTSTNVQAYIDDLESNDGASMIGLTPVGDVTLNTVQLAVQQLDTDKGSLLHKNDWTGGPQKLGYTIAATTQGVDWPGWQALVYRKNGGSTDNISALIGHAYHDGNFNISKGTWGIVTETWSNPTNYSTLIGGEFGIISQCPTMAEPIVGVNAVFKNRLDVATHPVAAVVDGSEYNHDSSAIFISSQARPSGAGAAWSQVGSGWQTAIRVGDLGFGSGLDWEGGSYFPGSTTKKAYTTIVDMTNALTDLAGGTPWFALYKNSETYWGMRFSGTLTGQLDTYNLKANAGGLGYAIGDTGTFTSGGGLGAKYWVTAIAGGGAVTEVVIYGKNAGGGGSGYVVTAGATTAVTTGAGNGALTIDITLGTGLIYGANIGIGAAGLGYVVGDFVALDGGTAGYAKPRLRVSTVGGGGAVTGFILQTTELVSPFAPEVYSIGRGHTVGAGKATTTLTGIGAGLTVNVSVVQDELVIGGERWEFWRMSNPSCPISSGSRHGFIDSSFPGKPPTIDTSGATYTFPIDRPF